MCHVSRVTCHMSHVTCHMPHSFFFFFSGQSAEACRWRVCYQRGLPRLVLLVTTKTGGTQWANSEGEVSITSLKCITSANTTKSTQKTTTTNHSCTTTNHFKFKLITTIIPTKITTMTIFARCNSFWNFLFF